MALKLMYITNDPEVALIAERNGVDRIWIDLETLGKEERQKGMNTVKSQHTVADVAVIAKAISKSEVLVRINPWNSGSEEEIEAVIAAGADIIMLPMWKTVSEVKKFLQTVGTRARTLLLLETKEAQMCLSEVLQLSGLDEIHIGLNDLHLSYGLDFMFELLANGTVESICSKIRKAGLPYGFGGVARIGEGLLPAENIVMEHYRLGSTGVILSRSFCNAEEIGDISQIAKVFEENVKRLRAYEQACLQATQAEYLQNIQLVKTGVSKVVNIIKARKSNG